MVSNEVYQAEFNRAREVEAKNEDLQARLREKSDSLEKYKKRIAELEAAQSDLDKRARLSAASADDASKRAEIIRAERESLAADLDVAKRSAKAVENDASILKEKLKNCEENRKAGASDAETRLVQREKQLEDLRGRVQSLEAERDVMIEANRKLEQEKKERIEEVSKTYDGLLENMKSEIEKGQVEITNLKGKLSVKLLDEILFPSGGADILPQGREVLKKVAGALKGAEGKLILIEGHTDNVPIKPPLTEKFPTNWSLSTSRAVSVVRFLNEKEGIAGERLAAAGYGEWRPVADNSTKEGRAKNRRIEIKIVPLEKD